MSSPSEITRLLTDWSAGDEAALDRLLPLVYDELRRMASGYMRRERPDPLDPRTIEAVQRLIMLYQSRGMPRKAAEYSALLPQTMTARP